MAPHTTAQATGPLDEWLLNLPLDARFVKLLPEGPVSLVMDPEQLHGLQTFAMGMRLERAIREKDHLQLAFGGDFFVLVVDGIILALDSEKGPLAAAFTTADIVLGFVQTHVPREMHARTHMKRVAGTTLFGEVAREGAGLIINASVPDGFVTFDLATCAALIEV